MGRAGSDTTFPDRIIAGRKMLSGFAFLVFTLTAAPAFAVPPTAVDDNDSTQEDNPVTTDVLANDSDDDGDGISVTPQGNTGTANGSFSCTAANCEYTPDANFNGADSYVYEVCDDGVAQPSCATATVNITITPVNDPPVANNDTETVDEDSVNNTLNVTSNDTDVEGDTLTVTNASASNGSASPSGGNVNYTPNAGFVGGDTINYTISDGNGGSDSATVAVTVSNTNDAPTANNDVATVDEDSSNNVINVTANDTDPDGDPLTVTNASASNGSATPSGGNVMYTPNANYFGGDTIIYTISDGNGGSDNATVAVTVDPVNDQPVAVDDNDTTPENTPVTTNVRANDSDIDPGDTLNVTVQTNNATANGSVTCSAANCTYTPDLNFNGNDSYGYQVCDNGSPQLCDTATVSISVSSVNDVPQITGVVAPLSTTEDTSLAITLNDLTVDDADNVYPNDFTLTVQNGSNYTRSNISPGSTTITPAADFVGDLTVPVTVNDGEDSSPVFNLTVTVIAENDQPVITGQVALSTPEDSSITVVLADVTVSDPDSSTFTLQLLDGSNYSRSGNTVTPTPNFNGQLSVGATVTDDTALTSPVFPLVIDITSVNDLPVLDAPIGAQNAVESSAFNLNVSGNFSDADGESLTFTATGLPSSGNIRINSQTGVFSGTPRLEDTTPAVYTVTVRATDGVGAFATDTFQLTISALDRANVSLSISGAPNPAITNDELRWTFTAQNPVGPQAGAGVELTGSIVGSGLTVVESGSNTCTIRTPSSQVTEFDCTLGGLPVGGTASVVISSTTSQEGDVYVFATAAGANPVPIDPNMDDNSVQVAVGVSAIYSNGSVQSLGNSTVLSVASGDVNGDGFADLVVGTSAGRSVEIYFGTGFRDFAVSPILVPDNMSNEGVALADFDNNGTLDLVVANGGAEMSRVYSNDGAGNFSLMATLTEATFGQDVAVGDFDGDGLVNDIAVATIAGNPVYLGNGSGGFNLHATLGNANSLGVAAGRLNDDSRDDLIFANAGSASRSWTKDSGAGFTSRDQIQIGDATSVALADFGGNGRPDAVFGRTPGDTDDIPSNPVLINNGSANFGSPTELLGLSPTSDVFAGDVSGDGLADIVFINTSGVHQIWNATGSGFALHSEQIFEGGASAGVLGELGMTDVGIPGGIDLAMGGATSAGLGVFLNDSFGNLGGGDAVPPVLTLIGPDPLDVASNTVFNDPGASATDNIDGDISASVTTVNPVNTALVGVYIVTYDVSDAAGNPALPITRTVNVLPAAGSGGGGGGGAITYWTLLFLILTLIVGQVTYLRGADMSTRRKQLLRRK